MICDELNVVSQLSNVRFDCTTAIQLGTNSCLYNLCGACFLLNTSIFVVNIVAIFYSC